MNREPVSAKGIFDPTLGILVYKRGYHMISGIELKAVLGEVH